MFLTLELISAGGGGGGGGTTSPGSVFAIAAQTRNQIAVAGALDAGVLDAAIPITNPLLLALLNLPSAADARQAFDALSGEVFGTVQNTQATHMHFTREAMLGRMRQASYSSDAPPNGLAALSFGGPELAYASGDAGTNAMASTMAAVPGKAPARPVGPSRDLTFWAQGLGGWGHADSDGNAASVRSRFGGFLSGADVRLGETWRAGLVAGYMRTDLNVDDRSSSAGIDSVQFGGYAGGKVGAFNVRGGASYSYDKIDTSRGIVFPGFTDQASAHFHGNVGQVFGEVGYGMALGASCTRAAGGSGLRHVRDDSFAESGRPCRTVGDQHQSEHQLFHARPARGHGRSARQRHGADPARFAAMAICLRRRDAGHRARVPEHRHIRSRLPAFRLRATARSSKAALTGASARRPSSARTTRANSPPTPKATPSRVR